MPGHSFSALLTDVRACQTCAAELPFSPRPVFQLAKSARLLVCGQAPGTLAHDRATPFNDPSGDRLRDWLQIDRATFYDSRRIGILPMGFCYPGRDAHGGDCPPRPECAQAWHEKILAHLSQVELVLLVGQYAQAWHLGERRKATVRETVKAWRDYLPRYLPLPHPSWRNNAWLKSNPWFENEVLPYLRREVRLLVGGGAGP
jgi:uracil-DNA glycosylase